MKFKDYAEALNALLKTNPEVGEFDAVYAVDESGNEFKPVCFHPTPGNFDAESRGFLSPDEIGDKKPNAVCVN